MTRARTHELWEQYLTGSDSNAEPVLPEPGDKAPTKAQTR